MDKPLWPARNVAEYAYCPRLFYYMEVEGIHVSSEDTAQGSRLHKRVDSPSATKRRTCEDEDNAERPAIARSLTLTDDDLGLTATLDLTEISGDVAVPVEYRKGRPRTLKKLGEPETPEEPDGSDDELVPWPTDRVQVGLQAILLEQAGYRVPHAVLYYAAVRRRVQIQVTDDLRREALETLYAAQQCATGARPLPLVNDPRCPKCSLQQICLPDEINTSTVAESGTPRKLWPPRDDGIHLVAQRQGTRIGIRGSTLHVVESDGSSGGELPLAGVESLSLLGGVQISTQALHTLADRGIPVAFLSAAGRLVAMLDPLDSVSAQTRRNQVRLLDDPAACLALSRQLIQSKIRNQRTLLMRNAEGFPKAALEAMAGEATQSQTATSPDSLRGHEGRAAAIYFENFSRMLAGPEAVEFDTNGRQRRPPPDPINACLSLAYTMLVHECVAALRTARLEPTIGAFHVSRPGRPALALDLMEPFRPLIADSMTITAFQRGELRKGHFQTTAAGCLFTDAGRRAFFAVYGRRMAEEVTHPVFGYRLSYRRMIILHAKMIAAWVNGEVPTLSFLTTR